MNPHQHQLYTGMPHISAFRNPGDFFSESISLMIHRQGSDEEPSQKYYTAKLSWSEMKDQFPSDPPATLIIRREEATKLMDQLWSAGVRPSDIGTPGHLEATQAHLEDFRRIVSKQLGVELK